MALALLFRALVRNIARSLALLVLGGCTASIGDAPSGDDAPPYRGDALVVRLVTDAARAQRVPRDVLLALGWAETRLVPRTGELPPGAHDADELAEEHSDEGATCGLFGLDQGSARDEAASLLGADPSLLCEQADLEANAAAARLRALAGGDAAPPLDDTRAWLAALDEWHPALAEAAFPYGEYVAQVMSMGFRGEDEVGAAIYLPPVDGLVELPTLTSEDGDVGASLGYARPDTPLAEWRGPACDYRAASRGRGDIRFVVIHTCEGGFAGCLSTLRSCGGSVVSAHYVTSYTGYTAQVVEENDIAWHVGCLNGSSIGIEHEGFAGSSTHPDAQLCRTARIVRSICDRYGISCDRSHIIGHVEANRLYCGGDHWDPGPHWDWTTFMNYVNHGCGCTPHEEICNGRDDDCDRRVDEGVTNACGTCGPVPTETCNGRDDDCDGTVDENVCDRADPSGDALPSGIDLGSTVERVITFRNAGTTTWRSAHYRIVASGTGASVALSGGIDSDVAPGERARVTVAITPSSEDAIGVRVEVQRDGSAIASAWTGSSRGQRPAFAARFVDVSAPMVIDASAWADGYASVENAGREPFELGTVIAAREDGPITVRDALVPALAPGESARVPVRFGAQWVRVETIASATLVVRSADGVTATWPDSGRRIEIGIVPTPGGETGPTAEPAHEAVLLGGCSAAPSRGRGAPWIVVVGLFAFAWRARKRRGREAIAFAALSASLAGCTGALCDSDAACELTLTSIAPSEGSARGGEVVAIEGLGLERAVGVRLGDRPAALLTRREDRLVVRTPTAVAGTVDVVIELDDGGARVWPGAYTFRPLELAFDEVESALPADSVEPRDGASADFDRDGDLDLLVVVRGGVPRLFLNDGEGAFAAAPEGSVDAPEVDAVGVAIADVDADGDIDVFVPVYARGQDVLLRNEGGRLVADPAALPPDATSDHAAAFGDLDGDGDADLVVAESGRDADMRMAERVLLNDGRGVFTIVEGAIVDRDDRTTGVALGDVDGDGVLDLVAANDGDDDAHLRLLLGAGDGTFVDAEPGAMPLPIEASRRPLLGDLDGDDDLDLFAIGRGQDHLLINDGSGHFFDATFLTLPTDDAYGFGGALADVDLDGDLDALVANSGTTSRLLVNEGGRLRDASLLLRASEGPTRQVLALDVDAEGAPDLVWIEGPDTPSRISLADRALDAMDEPEGISRDALTVSAGCSASAGRGGSAIALALFAMALLLRRVRARASLFAGLAMMLAGCAQPAPAVESMTPSVLSARGGERLALRGRDLDLVDVRIGGVAATLIDRAPDALVVETPPLVAGLTEVELVMNERRAWTGELMVEPLPVRFALEDVGEAIAARHVVLHDLDGDGDLDAAVALRDRLAAIFVNDEGALREAPERLPEGLGGQAMDLAVGDLSGDGLPDLYVVTGAGESDRVLLQATDGRFLDVTGAVPEDLAQTTGVALADLDDDGELDVVTARWRHPDGVTDGPLGVRVLLNEGGARFRDVTPSFPELAGDPSFGVAVADFDRDGREDLFIANAGAPSRLLLGRAGARFLPTFGAIPEIAWDARTPEVTDVEGDGDLDIVLPTLGRDVLLRNDGRARFGDATRFAMGTREGHTESITACDLDRDGDVDLVGAGYASPDNVLELSDGARWFADYAARLDMLPEATEVRFAAGDLDRDGDLDLVLGATGAPLRVLRHEGGPLRIVGGVSIELPRIDE